MSTRYYNPDIGRFLNADAIITTNMSLTDCNMCSYCGNNPVNNIDSSGTIRRMFGAEATVVYQKDIYEEEYVPPVMNMFVTVKQGSYTTSTISKKGDASKPISVYAEGRSDNWELSSVGLNINIQEFALSVNIGLDDISLSTSLEGKNQDVHSCAVIVDLSQLKVGIEFDKTSQIFNNENLTETTYVNASFTVMGLAAAAMAAMYGDYSMFATR